MPLDEKTAGSVKALKDAAKALSDAGDREAAVRALESVRAALASVEDSLDQGPGLASFFQSVGEGIIEAQRDLDYEAIGFAEQRPEGTVPTVFHIPRVRAEFQFGLQQRKSRGFSIFIASRENTEERSLQQKVEFEIVAAPAPPEMLPALGAAAQRAPIRERLEQHAGILQGEARKGSDEAREAEIALALSKAVEKGEGTLIVTGPTAWIVLWRRRAPAEGERPYAGLVVALVPRLTGTAGKDAIAIFSGAELPNNTPSDVKDMLDYLYREVSAGRAG